MRNHSKPYDNSNILHCFFSLEKIVKMLKSCCVKNCSNSTKNNENVKFYLLSKDKVRRKLWLNATVRVYIDKNRNIDNNRIWSPKSLHVYAYSIQTKRTCGLVSFRNFPFFLEYKRLVS